jgi:hypothetical protein
MSDILFNLHPKRFIQSDEPGLVAGYTFADNELAQWGKYINRANTGAGFDLTTRVGTPLVGQGGGLRSYDGASQWAGVVNAQSFAYRAHMEFEVTPPGFAQVVYNQPHQIRTFAGTVDCTFDGISTVTTPFNLVGRGPFEASFYHNGTNLRAFCNGVFVNQIACAAPAVPAGSCFIGRGTTAKAVRFYASGYLSDATIRASYVKDFASKVLWQWQPRDCGEGPAGGILTNSIIPFGEFFCPLGSANLKFVYIRDVHGNDGSLFLNETTVGSHRISFPVHRPFFGSWFINQVISNPATDDSQISFDTIRGESVSGGSGASYWIRSHQSGGLWSLEWMRGGVGPLTSVTMPVPVANSRIQILGTRRVDGVFQIHARVFGGKWYSSALSAADTTYLTTSYISLLPRGGYLGQMSYYQGEMLSHELGI